MKKIILISFCAAMFASQAFAQEPTGKFDDKGCGTTVTTNVTPYNNGSKNVTVDNNSDKAAKITTIEPDGKVQQKTVPAGKTNEYITTPKNSDVTVKCDD